MMMMLRDDLVIELFEKPEFPPIWIEGIDVENNEYSFCDTTGQLFRPKITKCGSILFQPKFVLEPFGNPSLDNALSMLELAISLERNDYFDTLESLRDNITLNSA